MKIVTLLGELQALDTKLDENAATRTTLKAKLADAKELQDARAALETSDKADTELQAKLRALELETGGLSEKLGQVSERLYSGRITNAKELAGLNEDEKMLQRRKSELEDQELAIMEQLEKSSTSLKSKRTTFDQVSAQTEQQQGKSRAALNDLNAATADLTQKREAMVAQLTPELVRTYDILRKSKKGRAVAPIKGNSCSLCGHEIPIGLLARVRAGNEVMFCSNCERILLP